MPPFSFFLRLRLGTVLALALAFTSTSHLHATTFVIEAAQLELPGGWETVSTPRNAIRPQIHSRRPSCQGRSRRVAVTLPRCRPVGGSGSRRKDYPADRPGVCHFTVRLGNTRSTTIFGRHGHAELDGWAWEDGGFFDLPAGETLVAIGDESTGSARCDALVLTDSSSLSPRPGCVDGSWPRPAPCSRR